MTSTSRRALQDIMTNTKITRSIDAIAVKSTRSRRMSTASPLTRLTPDVSKFESKTSFLDLPRELRDRTYNYAIPDHRDCCDECKRNGIPVHVATEHPPHISLDRIEPSLSQTCRQIREETLPIFYSKTSFTFVIHGWHIVCVLEAWRKMLRDEYANSIRLLRFNMLTNEDLPNAQHFLKTMEKNFNPECKYTFCGESPRMCDAFERTCEIGKTMREKGMSWDEVEDILDKVAHVLCAGGFEGTWRTAAEDSSEDEEDDEYESMDEDEDDLPDLIDTES